MNKDLIMIDKNCNAVSDENGNIRIIKKDSDKINFLEILSTENEIENIALDIEKLKKEISILEHKKEKIDLILMIPAVSVISMFILKMLPPLILLYTIIVSYILLTPLYLEKSYYKGKKKSILAKIELLNQKENELSTKLENIKRQINYRTVNKTLDIKNLLEELNKNNSEQVENTLAKINAIEKENIPEVISITSLFEKRQAFTSEENEHIKKLSLTKRKK